jgi:UTP-glucose-1-phosphate uridylyltransferase/mevalonate kinase
MNDTYDIFVPGRVCLFGEHSDWAGTYRRINSTIAPGKVIIAGTNQGIHAKVKPHSSKLILRSTLPDGSRTETFELPMQSSALLEEAEKGGFFSYAAGVAYMMLTYYHIDGIEIDNYRTTMPVKKGLSSSAALCVLVARAFNRAYDLKLTTRAEMEIAYQGEILTPSRCGRMDQGCAFGQVPVLMTFDGDLLKTNRIRVKTPIHMLIGDLKGEKDTIQILADLNKAYPFAADETTKNVQKYLGEISADIVTRAVPAIQDGDVETLGRLMTEAQKHFDAYLIPASPSQLGSPKLHQILADPEVKALTYGGKGVGSQGDGCVQFVTRGEKEREKLAEHLTKTYGMDCFGLDLKPAATVRKAVIPAAGFGTRMFPASKAIKKGFFPIVTSDGICKPVILAIVEEAMQSGIEEIAIVVPPDDLEIFRDFFSERLSPEHYNRLSDAHRKYLKYLLRLGDRITFIPQEDALGFGHAVHCAKDWVGGEPFLLMLGDHLYVSDTTKPCARQLVEVFEANAQRSTVGVYIAPIDEVPHYGTVRATPMGDEGKTFEAAEFAEKPNTDYAAQNLLTPGLGDNQFLCVYGQYVLTPAIFDHIEQQMQQVDTASGAEIQLTTAMETLRHAEGMLVHIVDGAHYDTGLPEPYVQTIRAIHSGNSAVAQYKSTSMVKE